MNNGITITGNFIIISADEWYKMRKENEILKLEIQRLEDELENFRFR